MSSYLGVDLGGTKVRVGEVNDKGEIVKVISSSSFASGTKEDIINNILKLINEFDLSNIEGIGIGVPGPVNQKTGSMTMANNIPALKDVPIVSIIEEKTGKKTYMENDADVAGLAEAVYGAGKDYDIVYYITHSTGIGGGLIINKRVVSGRKGFGGEVANVFVKANGIKKNNLIAGAFENEASGTALALKAKELISDDIKDAEDVFNLIRNNKSEIADELVEDMSKSIAILLSDIAAIIAPDCFVIGGGCSNASELYFHRIEKYFKEYCHDYNNDTPIFKANIKEPGVIGASLLAKR